MRAPHSASLFYHRRFVDLKGRPKHHGHLVYPNAQYKPLGGDATAIVYKEHRNPHPDLLRFEVAFGELAGLFLEAHLTPKQVLVQNEAHEPVGVACSHVSYTIACREILSTTFYECHDEPLGPRFQKKKVLDSAEIPYYFLNELGLFQHLSKAYECGDVSLDMQSLVSVLTTSYTLEEDDLHKGNLGFYLVSKNNKPTLVFFKIDHDLMLADSVMSHCHSRWLNWLHGAGAFDITARDLLHFPNLVDSQNYYWPTVCRLAVGGGSKAYSFDETEAFSRMCNSASFRLLKWRSFYKHILIPPELIMQSLERHFSKDAPHERAQMALIKHAIVVRQSKLRAVLFSLPEFRAFVGDMDEASQGALMKEVIHSATPCKASEVAFALSLEMNKLQSLCAGFQPGDTPLHAAIRLQDYRYDESLQAFESFVNQRNKAGQTPLDVAIHRACWSQQRADDIRCDAMCTVKHLLREGAHQTLNYKQHVFSNNIDMPSYFFHSEYLTRARHAEQVFDLKTILRDLGEDHRYALKMKKEVAVICVCEFMKRHEGSSTLASMLTQLKWEVKRSPELQFIRQLRSQLWIVRIIRGLLGGTSTEVQLNRLMDDALNRLQPRRSCWSFFRIPSWMYRTSNETMCVVTNHLLSP